VSEVETLVREVFSRWNEGERDFDDDVFNPSLTIHSALTGDMYEGADGLQTWTAEIDDQFKDWNLVVEETETLDDDRILVRGEIQMTGRQSEVAIEQPASWIIEFEDGRLSSIHNFIGRNAAAKFVKGEA
jgi:ketosteroid isomerase-like protein